MDIVHAGFDALDIAFSGHLPRPVERQLEGARHAAQESMTDQLIEIGGIWGHVPDTGARGGYRWRFDTGPEGEIWTFKQAKRGDDWNIRVSVRAAALVARGWQGVKDDLYATLNAMGGKIEKESISRLDFAVDILAPGFAPDPAAFVAHYATRRAEHYETLPNEDFAIRRIGGGRIGTITLGKMPNRQVTIYNKRREVIDHRHHKSWWWQVWDLDRDDLENEVWRVEVRLGKHHLKERWNVSTWADIEAAMPDMLGAALEDVRLCEPTADSNRARWSMHPLWQAALARVRDCFGLRTRIAPGKVRAERRHVIRNTYENLMLGIAAGYAVTRNVTPADDGDLADTLAGYVRDMLSYNITADRDAFLRKWAKARNRLYFTHEGDDDAERGVRPDRGYPTADAGAIAYAGHAACAGTGQGGGGVYEPA